MAKAKVSLVTCQQYPNLEADDDGLLDALRSNGIEPQIVFWDDPDIDWEEAGVCVIRSVRDYADRKTEFLNWAHQVPRLLNPADVVEWATDKHYLIELEKRGLPVVPTTWLEASAGLSKHQVHTRFPAHGDFVVKPAVSSGARQMGRYDATSGSSRMHAINHAVDLLGQGHTVMVQRYLPQIDGAGEVSLVYMNGVLTHCAEKEAMLAGVTDKGEELETHVTGVRPPSAKEWEWGEKARRVVHRYIRDRLNHDQQFLFLRIDIVPDGQGSYYLMEISPVDAKLHLQQLENGVQLFADAIATRVLW